MVYALADDLRNATINVQVDAIDASSPTPGYMVLYDAGDNVLATWTFSAQAFDSAGSAGGNAEGLATANAIVAAVATGSGAADYVSVFDGGANLRWKMGVGVGTGEVQMTSTTVAVSDTLSISLFTFAMSAGTAP